jgi:hypothetical protein
MPERNMAHTLYFQPLEHDMEMNRNLERERERAKLSR